VDKKELPVVLQHDINTSMLYALPLCAVLAEEKLLPWYYENFIEVLYHSGYQYAGLDRRFEATKNFIEIFEKISFTNEMIGRLDIVEFLKKYINEEFYVYIMLDEYYTPHKENYQKRHFCHDFLLHGYDDNTQSFLAISFDENRIFSKMSQKYMDVRNAYESEWTYQDNDMIYAVTIFRKRPLRTAYQFSLNRFLNRLYHYMQSIPYEDADYFSLSIQDEERYFYRTYYGFETYEALAGFIFNQGHLTGDVFRWLHFVYEHKNSLYKRFLYIADHFQLPEELIKDIQSFHAVVDRYNAIRMKAIKSGYITEESVKSNNIKKVVDELQNAAECERNILLFIFEGLKQVELNSNDCFFPPNLCLSADIIISPQPLIENINYLYRKAVTYKWENKKYICRMRMQWFDLIIFTFCDGRKRYWPTFSEKKKIRDEWFLTIPSDILTIEVFDNNAIPDDFLCAVYEENCTYNKPAAASSCWEESSGVTSLDRTAENAINGDPFNFWFAKMDHGIGEYLQVDLTRLVRFNMIVIQQRDEDGGDRINGFKIQTSFDNEIWTDVYEYKGDRIGVIPCYYVIGPSEARYVKFLITGIEPDEFGFVVPGIKRFELYNYEDLELIGIKKSGTLNEEFFPQKQIFYPKDI